MTMQAPMPKSSGSSMSELSSFHYEPMIVSTSMNKTPKAVQRSSASCLPDQPSPFKQLEDEAKSLFPLVEHCELPSITPDLLSAILTGTREFPKDGIVIIDTRHKFEFCGGHININDSLSPDMIAALHSRGAVNLNGPSCIEEFYMKNLERGKEMAIVFHCEFSSARAPKLFRHMRNIDRQRHIEVYPELGFPHMYLLHGGYKAFFDGHSELCDPKAYVRMADPLHAEDLRASNRVLKRSWTARSENSKNCRIRTQDDVLTDVSNFSKRTEVSVRSCSACLTFGQ